MESALTAKGQVTIPKAIRKHLHVGPGDRIKFFVHPDGSVVILPQIHASALKGIVRSRRNAASLDDMEAAIGEAAAGTMRRSRRALLRS
jgi:AbrB family looped-hinge helix DNA binding protein